ncbi:enoyl-CoA hydratase/isomerase family protein [Gordonia aurantiaca]|uniref:enoyl-CoA hydratase/isomerase family protein n=1 Tax=Gordonia sp. B21 TaxID=3151852 RepID=UPI0032634519
MAPTLDIRDDIAVLILGEDENRFSPDHLDDLGDLLTEAEDSARGLVTTGTGKFYSDGLDLEWLLSNPDRTEWYVERVQQLFIRVLTFPLPTIAAVNGHAFGAGAMLAIAHDFRVMRADRGFYCFPEVDINIPFTTGMAALIQAKVTPQTAIESMTTGRRYGGPDALAAGLVDAIADEDAVISTALDRLKPLLDKDENTLATIKKTMFRSTVDALTEEGRTG